MKICVSKSVNEKKNAENLRFHWQLPLGIENIYVLRVRKFGTVMVILVQSCPSCAN